MYCDQTYPSNQQEASDMKYAMHDYDVDRNINYPKGSYHGNIIPSEGNDAVYRDRDPD